MHAIRPTQPTEAQPARWLPGAPSHVDAATLAIDRRVVRRARCPQCGHRGLKPHAQQQGTHYRVIGRCCHCRARTEF